jgi:hypothetical protein
MVLHFAAGTLEMAMLSSAADYISKQWSMNVKTAAHHDPALIGPDIFDTISIVPNTSIGQASRGGTFG